MLRGKNKDKEIDISSLNHILRVSRNIIDIVFIMAIVMVVLLGTYLVKEWKIFHFIGQVLVVISPIFIGLLIAWFFDPFVTMLQEKKVPRVIGCILVMIIVVGLLFLVAYLFIPSLISQIREFLVTMPELLDNITKFVTRFIDKMDVGNYFNTDDLISEISSSLTNYGIEFGTNLPKYLFNFGKSLITGGIHFVLGLMIGFYLLYDFNKFNNTVYSVLPYNWRDGYKELTHRINTSLRSYIQGLLMVMLLVFITQSIGLTLAGMEAPILFALFCAITDVIPYFGPYIGAIPAIIVGFNLSFVTGICVIIAILIVQLLENNFYQPLIMGHTMKLHPVTIMLGLLIFQHFFGIIGMVIATPVIACLKVLLEFINEKYSFMSKINKEQLSND